jgi:transposase
MPAALSTDLRTRFITAYEAGEGSLRELAARFDIGEATTNRWWSRYKRTGELEARVSDGGHKPTLDDTDLESIDLIVFEHPNVTVLELVEMFVEEGGQRVSRSTMSRALQRLNLTRKKTRQGSRRSKRRT